MGVSMFTRIIVIALAVAVVATTTVEAVAYCSEPSAPSFYGSKPTEPYKPFCINEFSNTHTCSEWEIDSYNRDVDLYNSQLRSYQMAVSRYIDELNDYVREAVEYAECEVADL